MSQSYSSKFVLVSTPGQLAELSRLASDSSEEWHPDELREMVVHRMTCPLESDLIWRALG